MIFLQILNSSLRSSQILFSYSALVTHSLGFSLKFEAHLKNCNKVFVKLETIEGVHGADPLSDLIENPPTSFDFRPA